MDPEFPVSIEHALSPECWEYRGEGVHAIVVGYIGSEDHFRGKVLRIRKWQAPLKKQLEERKECHVEEEINAFKQEESYARKFGAILEKEIGKRRMNLGFFIPVTREFLEAVSAEIESSREMRFVSISAIDLCTPFVTCMLDASFVSTPFKIISPMICGEFKPKCGFIPDFGDEIHRTHTRFAMHQYYKKQLGAIRKISKYDPLDLFSKDLMRIRHAVEAVTDNPQNSFRVFVNGEFAFGDKKMATEGFEDGMKKLHAVEQKMPNSWEGMIEDILSLAIFEDDTMQRILNLQRNDDMGIHKIYEYYEALGEPVINTVDILTDESGQYSHEFVSIAKWLLAQTAKDFSVMVSFCEIDPSSIPESETPKNVINHNGRFFAWQSFVVDADPKSGKKIPYYVDMDDKIIDAFIRGTAQ